MQKIKGYFYTCLVALGFSITLGPLAALPAAAATPELFNPSFEQAGTAAATAYGWQPFMSGYKRVAGGRTGAFSLRLNNTSNSAYAGAYQRLDFNQASLKPVFIGGYVKGSNIVKKSGSYLGAGLYAEIHMNDGSVAYWNSIANDGTFGWRWVGFNTGTLASVNKPISYIFVVPILGQATGIATFDDIRVTEYEPKQAAVTLMFDDGELTTYSQAKPILDVFNFKGTSAIITDYVDDDEREFMNYNEIKQLAAAGWEIVSHSVNHEDMTLMTASQTLGEFNVSYNALVAQGLAIKNFAFPFGAYNANLLAQSMQKYGSARAFELGDNPQGAFPYDIKVRRVIDTTTTTEVAGWLSEAAANKRWEVIVFHSIANTGDDAYHTSPAALRAMMQTIAASGIPVITYQQGLQLFATAK